MSRSVSVSGSQSSSSSSSSSEANLDEIVTEFFTKWNPKKLTPKFKKRYDELTELAKGFFQILFDGTPYEEESIYFKNESMKNMILAYPVWSPWIPGDGCGLHRKFKDTVGVLYHIISTIDELKADAPRLKEFNEKVDELSTDYQDLDHMLTYSVDYSLRIFFYTFFFFIQTCKQ